MTSLPRAPASEGAARPCSQQIDQKTRYEETSLRVGGVATKEGHRYKRATLTLAHLPLTNVASIRPVSEKNAVVTLLRLLGGGCSLENQDAQI